MAEKTLKELQEENILVTNEHLREQTEFYRQQNEETRAARANKQKRHDSQEATLALNRRQDRVRYRACTHQKGGKGDDLVNNRGNDPNHAVADQQQPSGEWWRMCTRCFATWKPGQVDCERCLGELVVAVDGKRKLCPNCKGKSGPGGIGYAQAMKWSTDNSPSGTVVYGLRQPSAEDLAEPLIEA